MSTGIDGNKISFFFQAEDGIRDYKVTGVQTCALPISRCDGPPRARAPSARRSRATCRGARRRRNRRGTRERGEQIGRASCRERGKLQEGEGITGMDGNKNRVSDELHCYADEKKTGSDR